MRIRGIANYSAQFVDHFAEIARALYAFLKGNGLKMRKNPRRLIVLPDWGERWWKSSEVRSKRPRTPSAPLVSKVLQKEEHPSIF